MKTITRRKRNSVFPLLKKILKGLHPPVKVVKSVNPINRFNRINNRVGGYLLDSLNRGVGLID